MFLGLYQWESPCKSTVSQAHEPHDNKQDRYKPRESPWTTYQNQSKNRKGHERGTHGHK